MTMKRSRPTSEMSAMARMVPGQVLSPHSDLRLSPLKFPENSTPVDSARSIPLGPPAFQPARLRRGSLGPPAFQPARLWHGSMPCQRRRKSRKPFKPAPNPSEQNIREGACQVAPNARSPDAGIEPASGEAGWKAGATSKPVISSPNDSLLESYCDSIGGSIVQVTVFRSYPVRSKPENNRWTVAWHDWATRLHESGHPSSWPALNRRPPASAAKYP